MDYLTVKEAGKMENRQLCGAVNCVKRRIEGAEKGILWIVP